MEIHIWAGTHGINNAYDHRNSNQSHKALQAMGGESVTYPIRNNVFVIGGNDYIGGYQGNDTLSGGSGSDTLKGRGSNDYLYGDSDNDFLLGGCGNDYLSGGSGDDYLFGGPGVDVLVDDGISWIDYEDIYTVCTDADNDVMYGDAGNDFMHGFAGNDFMDGGKGNDSLYGGAGNDSLYGGSGNDLLVGGNGNDFLNAYGRSSTEFDTLGGGSGSDKFVLGDSFGAYYQGDGYATITDYSYWQGDTIQLYGTSSNYSFSTRDYGGGSVIDTAIYYGSNLIAIIQDAININYSYVGQGMSANPDGGGTVNPDGSGGIFQDTTFIS